MDTLDYVYQSKYLSLVINRTRGWEYVTRENIPGAVAIAAFTASDEMVLIEQLRVPLQKQVIELPAGLVGDEPDVTGGMTAMDASLATAKNELMEEAGYKSEHWTFGFSGASSAGLTDECIDVWLAKECVKAGEGGGVGNEDIKIHLVPRQKVPEFLSGKQAEGMAVDLKIYGGLFLVHDGFTALSH